jgi:response regulator RpfG family c-di-GMP phosphodiesterase
MDGTEGVARPFARLAAYEWLCVGLGTAAISAAVLVASHEHLPQTGPLIALCVLSGLSVLYNADADEGGKIAASAEGMVVAAAIVAFRSSSPMLGPLLVGMAAAFWRIPRSRHHWFAVAGNLAVYGLPALVASALLTRLSLAAAPSTLELCAIAVPLAAVYALVNSSLIAWYFVAYQRVGFRDALRELLPHIAGAYVPFLFGAVVGQLSLVYGLVVFALASATFVMVQAVFTSYRELVQSESAALEGIVAAVERKDPYTAGHSKRVQRYARYMGTRLGWKGRNLARLEQHALMHDIGKLSVPNHILRKPGKLDANEREIMFRHEPAGAAILGAVPFLSLSADIAHGHGHKEGFDAAPNEAHLVHAADSFDAMTTTRAYRQAHTQAEAFEEMHAKIGRDFHPACVEALETEIAARGETYGLGFEEEVIKFDVEPPKTALGSTLADEAAADTNKPEPLPEPEPRELPKPETRNDTKPLLALGAIAATAAVAAALTHATPLTLMALAALVAAGELLCLRPLRRPARPLAYVVMLVALQTQSLQHATIAIAAGVVIACVLRRDARPIAPAAAAIATFAALDHALGTPNTAAVLTTLTIAALAALLTQELIETRGNMRAEPKNRLAELAILAGGPLAALGVAALGLGALPVLVVPLGLLTHGFTRTQKAHENLFAWLRAMSLAPEYARLVQPGHAERVAARALTLADQQHLDPDTRDQLEAAAWMERVGQCCLDETVTSNDEIVEASATILASSTLFEPASRILRGTLDPNEPAARILATAIAAEREAEAAPADMKDAARALLADASTEPDRAVGVE